MTKLIRIAAQTIFGAAILGLYAAAVRAIYLHQDHAAQERLANSKQFRMECNGDSLLNCDFTEIPQRINQFSEVVLPTLLWASVLLAAIIGAAGYFTRSVRRATSALSRGG